MAFFFNAYVTITISFSLEKEHYNRLIIKKSQKVTTVAPENVIKAGTLRATVHIYTERTMCSTVVAFPGCNGGSEMEGN